MRWLILPQPVLTSSASLTPAFEQIGTVLPFVPQTLGTFVCPCARRPRSSFRACQLAVNLKSVVFEPENPEDFRSHAHWAIRLFPMRTERAMFKFHNFSLVACAIGYG